MSFTSEFLDKTGKIEYPTKESPQKHFVLC